MSRSKRLIIIAAASLCLFLTAAYALIMIFANDGENPEADTQDTRILIEYTKVSSVSALSFTGTDGEVSVSRINGAWCAEGNPCIPVSDTAVEALIGKFEYMLAIRLIASNCDDLSQYGLDTPSLTLKLTAAGKDKLYIFGDESNYYDGCYFKTGEGDSVYIVSGNYSSALDITLEALLDTAQLPTLNNISRIDFTSAHGFELGFPAGDSSEDLYANELFTLVRSFSTDKYIDCKSSSYATFGLDEPAVLVIDGTLKLSLSVGEDDSLIYFRIGDFELIYLLSSADNKLLAEYIGKSV